MTSRKKTGPPKGFRTDLRIGADGCRWDFGRFFSHVTRVLPSDCWIWTGSRAGRNLTYGSYAGKGSAHRASYRIFVGPVPDGHDVDHLCGVHLCVNPAHLEAVTHEENMRRRFSKMTHCKNGHEFTPENLYENAPQRACKTCKRAAASRQRQRQKSARAAHQAVA